MSTDATQWAWKIRGISAPQKLVLLALADRAGEDHTCYPSARRLHIDTGHDRKTILDAITSLIELGHVADTGNRIGNGVRVLRLVGVSGREQTDPVIGTGTTSGTGTKSGTTTDTRTGTGPDPNRYQKRDATHPGSGTGTGTRSGIQNLPLNLKENLERERAGARGAHTPVGHSRFAPVDWEPDPAIERMARVQPGVDREFELGQFRMHEFLNGRQDWDRAWCKWLNAARPRTGVTSNPGVDPFEELRRLAAAEAEAKTGAGA